MGEEGVTVVTAGDARLVRTGQQLAVLLLPGAKVHSYGWILGIVTGAVGLLSLVWVTLSLAGQAPWQLGLGSALVTGALGTAAWLILRKAARAKARPHDQQRTVAVFVDRLPFDRSRPPVYRSICTPRQKPMRSLTSLRASGQGCS